MFFLDFSDPLFEQENDIGRFIKNTDQETLVEPSHRRVTAIFGDAKTEDYYYEPQQIMDDTLMNVSFVSIITSLTWLC